MAKIKHLIFDMGNVLMRYDPEVPLKKFVKTEKARNLIRRELFEGPEWVEADRGMISEEEMYASVARRIPEKYHEELKKCVYEWIICMKPLEKSVKLCEDARKWGYQTYVLSNAAQSFYEYFPKFYRMEDFDGVVVSSDVHLIKPDVRIYAYLLEKYHLNPEECLFLDDREDNVEAARKAGMQSMLFTEDYETLRAFLKQNAGIEAYQQKKTIRKTVAKTLRTLLLPLFVAAAVLTSACTIAPEHIGHGSTATYMVQSSILQSPITFAASFIAIISACISGFFSVLRLL